MCMYCTPYIPIDMVVTVTEAVDEHKPAATIFPGNSGPTGLSLLSNPPATILYVVPHIRLETVTVTMSISLEIETEPENIHKLYVTQVRTNAHMYVHNIRMDICMFN